MRGHEAVKSAVQAYLETWVPLRLELIRQLLEVQTPVDPESIVLADELPDDPAKYPCIVVMSTRSLGMKRRSAASSGEIVTFDVDYEVVVVVGVERGQYGAQEDAVRDRDRLLLAVRECVLLPAELDEATTILQSPLPEEVTGPAAQSLRGRPLAAGQITFRVRAVEALVPAATVESITGVDLSTSAVTAASPLP